MQNVWVWIVVAIVVVGGGFWWYQSMQTPTAPADTSAPVSDTSGTPGTDTTSTGSTAPMTATVSYDGTSFSPSSVLIAKGGTVVFTGPANMWVASAPHPAHTGYDGTSRSEHCAAGYKGAKSFDQCLSGTSYSFTFDKTGTWPYHDHMNASAFGKIIVE